MRRLSGLKSQVEQWRDLERETHSLAGLVDLSMREGDYSLEEGLDKDIEVLARRLDQLEGQLVLRGEYDERGAILAIHAGAGGTESQDWVQMLLRMYLRWAERHDYQSKVLEISPGEEAGIKSVLVELTGDFVYGHLKAERGVHRLVRLSPFDASHLRHTSFALVEVLPQAEEDMEITVNPEDLRIDVFRASGPGGQHMQKSATAVRVTHLPTEIVVSCQNERSQFQNKETALKILRARLIERELEKRREERAKLKGEHLPAEWGNQIRSYILHPYKLVKDHRTEYENTDPEAVLNGQLDDFIQAYLTSTVGEADRA